jgi:hypothetical protein
MKTEPIMAKEYKISAGAMQTLNALLSAAADYAFVGSAHPDVQDAIEDRFKARVQSMRKLINRLEADSYHATFKAVSAEEAKRLQASK